MVLLDDVLARLAEAKTCGYHQGSQMATEPAALTALALLAHRREKAALPLLHWLAGLQSTEGSIGISESQATPCWPTGWAILAWQAAQRSSIADPKFARAIERGVQWALSTQGELIESNSPQGHDTMILGWPWVAGTHSWLEPTAMNLLALEHSGHSDHPRARQAVEMLQDRLLVSGGCNYGNTIVFGQELLPHLEPTGLCLLGLHGVFDATGRIGRSVEYLLRELSGKTATISLSYGLLGLAAQDRLPAEADHWLGEAAARTLARDVSSYKLALVALASLGTSCPLIPQSAESRVK